MGNDGGSIPKRRELVKEAARQKTTTEAKETQQEQQEHKWTTCQISQAPLRAPVVSDWLGNLYNKDAILEFLLPSDDPAVEALKPDQEKILGGRVKGLKDVVEVKFQEGEESLQRNGSPSSRWVCPVTNKSLGPAVKSAYIVPCGHAFAEIALKEVSETQCLQCNETYNSEDIITILPLADNEKKRLQERIDKLSEQGKTHALKKAPGSGKKRKKNGEVKDIDTATNGSSIEKRNGTVSTSGTRSGTATANSGIKNAATASLTAKILAEEQEKAKRRRLDPNENLKSLFSSSAKGAIQDGDFMTRGFSIPSGAKR